MSSNFAQRLERVELCDLGRKRLPSVVLLMGRRVLVLPRLFDASGRSGWHLGSGADEAVKKVFGRDIEASKVWSCSSPLTKFPNFFGR